MTQTKTMTWINVTTGKGNICIFDIGLSCPCKALFLLRLSSGWLIALVTCLGGSGCRACVGGDKGHQLVIWPFNTRGMLAAWPGMAQYSAAAKTGGH